ncbi:hypothetical protein Nmel_001481 [Mimus melanotis]
MKTGVFFLETQILETTSCMKPWGWRRRKRVEENETEDHQAGVGHTDAQTDSNCKLEDKAEDGDVLDCKKRPDEGEELEEEAVHSCDSCLQVFESLSDITEHKINQCQLTGKQYLSPCGFVHCSISDSHPLLLISLLFQLFYSCT